MAMAAAALLGSTAVAPALAVTDVKLLIPLNSQGRLALRAPGAGSNEALKTFAVAKKDVKFLTGDFKIECKEVRQKMARASTLCVASSSTSSPTSPESPFDVLSSRVENVSKWLTESCTTGSLARLVVSGVAAFGLSVLLGCSPVFTEPASANEQAVLNVGPSKEGYIVDDATVLNRVTKSEIRGILGELEAKTGYHIDMITVRKLTSKADAFEFADQVLEKWYPTIEVGNNKGIVLLVTTQKEGAVTGGPAFVKAVGDAVLEAVSSENLPVLATDEKYNEAFSSTAKRLINAIEGLPDIPGPKFQETKRESNFKTREETESKRGQFSIVVGGLLVIAFVVPMAQYYAYVSKK